MEETSEEVDNKEVKPDIEIGLVSLVSISKGSSEDYQMKDMKKLQIGQTCNDCDGFPDNNYKLNLHLNTAHDEVILQHNQCGVASIKDEQTFICRECNAGVEDEFHLQHHKDNYHELSFTILAAAVSKKHDEVDSGASVEEKHMKKKHIAIGIFVCDKCDKIKSQAYVVKDQTSTSERHSSVNESIFRSLATSASEVIQSNKQQKVLSKTMNG